MFTLRFSFVDFGVLKTKARSVSASQLTFDNLSRVKNRGAKFVHLVRQALQLS